MSRSEVITRRYLLRLWLADADEGVWRSSLEDPSSGERHGFGSLERLFTFLEAETTDLAARVQWEQSVLESDRAASGKESAIDVCIPRGRDADPGRMGGPGGKRSQMDSGTKR
jgi:hypothetical protein